MTLFGTAGIRGGVTDRVTPDLALSVGRTAAVVAAESSVDPPTFVLGRDGRTTGPGLAAAMEAGLESGGATVRRVGQVPTPTLAYAARGRYGVMITASHNPPHDNGIKLFDDGVEFDRDAERAVEERVADDPDPVAWDRWGDSASLAVLAEYREAVAEYARRTVGKPGDDDPLYPMRVAVDCGNGMGSLGTPQVLRALGARVSAVNANVDGHFPGRESKPTPETLAEFREYVADGDFAVGVAHDGDADRVVMVAPDGEVVHEDTVLAVLAAHYTRESQAADPVVVTTPNASGRIDERVEAEGGRVARVRLGALHEGIARERREGGDGTEVVFAAEPWKHIHTDFGGWIDGVASAAVLCALTATAGGVGTLREPVTERPYRKVSVECPDDDKTAVMDLVRERLPGVVEGSVDTDHGVRIDRTDGSWVLVRPSGTEPYVRVYAESDDVDAFVATAVEVVESAVADVR